MNKYVVSPTKTSGLKTMRALTELEIRQAASDFFRTLSAFSLCNSSFMCNLGCRRISLIRYLPSIFSNLPMALLSKPTKSNPEFSATARKVVMRQLSTAATRRCSGDQMPGMPLGNSGGVATSMASFNTGELIRPLRPLPQWSLTSYVDMLSIFGYFIQQRWLELRARPVTKVTARGEHAQFMPLL